MDDFFGLVNRLKYQWADNDLERLEAFATASPEIIEKIIKDNELSQSYFKPQMLKLLNRVITPEQIQALILIDENYADKFFSNLKTLGNSVSEISNNLWKIGNNKLGKWIQSTAALPLLNSYGIKNNQKNKNVQ
jgi:hypothetical protein